jgi:PIN domain nuclease of toxin-antitoxin system
MSILLDTCTLLWLQMEPSRVPLQLLQILLLADTRRLLSAAVVWEIAIKWSVGKLSLPFPPDNLGLVVRENAHVNAFSGAN